MRLLDFTVSGQSIKALLLTAFLGNLIDTAVTLYLSSLGYIEANPVMAWLLQWPAVFALVKLLAMGYVLRILWRNRAHRAAWWLAWAAAVVYGAIAVYYCAFFTLCLSFSYLSIGISRVVTFLALFDFQDAVFLTLIFRGCELYYYITVSLICQPLFRSFFKLFFTVSFRLCETQLLYYIILFGFCQALFSNFFEILFPSLNPSAL